MGGQSEAVRFAQRGEAIYRRKIRPVVEPQQNGHVVAIELDSEAYVLGEDELDAALKALERFPGKQFYFIRVGSPVMHKLR